VGAKNAKALKCTIVAGEGIKSSERRQHIAVETTKLEQLHLIVRARLNKDRALKVIPLKKSSL
jgi:hypothetical protein